jgi:hypothetical protein
MIKAMNSKAYGTIRDGVKEGMDIAWKQGKEGMDMAWKQGKRVHFRAPFTYDKSPGWGSRGWIGLGILSIAAMALGAWFYFRKRKQVADHYTMGEGPGRTWEPEKSQVDGQAVPAP